MAAFPISNWLLFKVVVPIPPLEIGNVPEVILDAFIFVIPEPEPDKLVADIVVPVKTPVNVRR